MLKLTGHQVNSTLFSLNDVTKQKTKSYLDASKLLCIRVEYVLTKHKLHQELFAGMVLCLTISRSPSVSFYISMNTFVQISLYPFDADLVAGLVLFQFAKLKHRFC